MTKISPSELVLNPEGSIYHLNLKPHHIAPNIIIVGNPDRVHRVSTHFDKIEHKIQKREFVTHTGIYKETPMTVLSTGIGPDNIDIVLNELDALVNIDLDNRTRKTETTSLNIVRVGTSGSLQEEIPVDNFVVSAFGMGLDNLLHYYNYQPNEEEKQLQQYIDENISRSYENLRPYTVQAHPPLVEKLAENSYQGITVTAPGFYAPQGRVLRGELAFPDLNNKLRQLEFGGYRFTNFEMETSALFGLSRLLGHNACTACAIIANRAARQFSEDPKKAVDRLIQYVLDQLTIS